DCRHVPLFTIACAATPAEAARIAKLKPDMIAIEPPDLIGTGISVSKARPSVITATTHRIRKIPVLCGAGITTGDDVAKAVELGVAGILVASAVTNAKDPKKVLMEFVKAFKKQ
ncbi:triose-phosphate isomerase, partial [Candidatus Woesearchaeota archaeon]|nr:triose-phosphate isomerase [Candidatus Woesearchaeota archaeon]